MLLRAIVGVTFIIALLHGAALAQHNDPPASSMSEREQCRSECHRVHCDQWTACNAAWPNAASAERDACKKRVEENETKCQKVCEAPKA